MAVLIDTGVLVGALSLDDPHYERAMGILKRLATGKAGALVTTDHVLSEGLTLLRKRPGDRRVSQAFADLVLGKSPILRMRWTDEGIVREAAALHLKHYGRKLSFVDCTLLVHAARLGCPVATLEAQFNGLVDVVS